MTYYDEVLSDSPLLYWRMDALSGTTEADESGNALDGTYAGTGYTLAEASPIATDAAAKAVRFDGSAGDPRLTRADDPNLDFNIDFSVEFWVKLDGLPAATQCILTKGGTAASRGNWMVRVDTSGQLLFGINDGANREVTMAAITPDAWHHVVIDYDVNTRVVSLHVDGSTVNTYSMPGTTVPTALTGSLVVATQGTLSENFDGWIAEIALYAIPVLGASRAFDHYIAGVGVGGGGGTPDAKKIQMMI